MSAFFLFLICILSSLPLYTYTGSVGGSDDIEIAQGTIQFEVANNNKIETYAAMRAGFSYENSAVTCTFDSIFPVLGTVDLKGGALYLERDLRFGNNASIINLGSIYAQNNMISLPENIELVEFEKGEQVQVAGDFTIEYVTKMEMPYFRCKRPIYSVDWSYDDNYILVATDKETSNPANELSILSFSGTIVKSVELSKDVYAARWHPSSYCIASGYKNDSIRTYQYTPPSSLSLKSTKDINNYITALDWTSDGNYLALGGRRNTPELYIYSQSNGYLTQVATCNLGGNSNVFNNALSWKSTNDYLAVGKYYNSSTTEKEFSICHFNGSTLVVDYQQDFSAGVGGVDWLSGSDVIAVGFYGGSISNRLRLYSYNTSTKVLTEETSVPELSSIMSVHWRSDGRYLAVAAYRDLKIYSYDSQDHSLTLQGTISTGNRRRINCIRWSHDGNYIILGEHSNRGYNVYIYNVQETAGFSNGGNDIVLNNVTFVFDSDLTISGNVTIEGNCVFNGNDNQLILDDNFNMMIASGASLACNNLILEDLSGNKVWCLAEDSSLRFKNSTIELSGDYTFSHGSLLFEEEVIITGTNVFTLTSNQTSTIAANSVLHFDSNTTLSYDSPIANRDLLYMSDETASLFFDGCMLYSTATGLRLTRGSVSISNDVTFSCLGTQLGEGICFGNGENSQSDVLLEILADAQLEVYGGLEYNNIGE